LKYFKWDDEFLRNTGLMVIGVGLFNLFNLLYHFFMVRALPPVEYGHLNSLMAVFMVVSVPASTVQTTVTKFVSSFYAQKRYDLIRNLIKHFLFLTSIIGIIIFLLIFLLSKYLASFLQISHSNLLILLGILLSFAMIIPIPWGGLQGLQKFISLTINLILNGGLKFIIGVCFIILGLGVFGALSAIIISYIVTIFISLIMLKAEISKGVAFVTKNKENLRKFNNSSLSEMYYYFLPIGITLLCFMMLTNIDLILVKHFFKPIEAGYYSIAQMVGKIILFLPIPVVMVMFPKINALEGQIEKKLPILNRSLYITLLFCFGAIVLVFIFPDFILKILTGKVYPECIPLVRLFSINMTIFSLILIILYYHLSTNKKGFLYPLIILALGQICAIIFFHRSLIEVLLSIGIIAFCLLIINFYLIYRRK